MLRQAIGLRHDQAITAASMALGLEPGGVEALWRRAGARCAPQSPPRPRWRRPAQPQDGHRPPGASRRCSVSV